MQWRDLLLVMNLGTASTMKVWFQNFTILLIGLSKERPILGDHTKAHIFGLREFGHGFDNEGMVSKLHYFAYWSFERKTYTR